MTRLEELAALPAGWLDGKGSAIAVAALDIMRSVLARDGAPQQTVFPTEEGGLTLEFKRDGWDWTIEASPAGTLSLYGVELAGSSAVLETPYGEDVDGVLRAVTIQG